MDQKLGEEFDKITQAVRDALAHQIEYSLKPNSNTSENADTVIMRYEIPVGTDIMIHWSWLRDKRVGKYTFGDFNRINTTKRVVYDAEEIIIDPVKKICKLEAFEDTSFSSSYYCFKLPKNDRHVSFIVVRQEHVVLLQENDKRSKTAEVKQN